MQAKSRAIAQSINNVGDAKSVLAIAEGGLLNVSDILLTIKEKVSQATNGVFGEQELQAIATQINDYMNEINDIVSQTKFSDHKLLSNNFTDKQFQIGPDAGDIITVSITQTIDQGTLLGIASNMIFSGSSVDVGSSVGLGNSTTLNSLAQSVDNALNTISMQIQYIGSLSNRLDFKETMLGVSKTNVDAAISRMYDADLAKEQMEMVKLQILQNTATAQLAQANAAPQLYLQLFQ
jgi:flagellin